MKQAISMLGRGGAFVAVVLLGLAAILGKNGPGNGPSPLPPVTILKDLYVSSSGTNQVKRYDATTGAFKEDFVGSITARLDGPKGLTFGPDVNGDGEQELYVSSWTTDAVKMYDGVTGRFIADFVTAGAGGLHHPDDLTFGPDGDLYVISRGSDQLKRYDGASGAYQGDFVSSLVGQRDAPCASGLEFGPDGHLYVSFVRTSNTRHVCSTAVKRFDGGTGAFLDDFVPASFRAEDLTFGPDGHLHVLHRGSSPQESYVVRRYDISSGGELAPFVPASVSGEHNANCLIFGPNDLLYVGSWQTGTVKRYDGTSSVGSIDTNGARPNDLTFGPDGHLYASVTLSGTGLVKRYDVAASTFMDNFVHSHETGGLSRPAGLVFGSDTTGDGKGELYVASNLTDEVKRYDGSTGEYLDDFVAAGAGGLDEPTGLIFGPDGHLYVASRGSDAVLRFDGTSGQFIDAFGQPSAASDLFHPTDVAFGPDGHLYVSTLSKKIQRYDGTSGQFIDDFVPATPPPSWPKTLVFGPNGDLWVGAFRVLRYDGASGAFVDYPGGTPTQDARDLFVGPEDALFVSDTETDRIVRYAGGSGSVFVEDLDNGGLDRPWGLAFGPPYFLPQ